MNNTLRVNEAAGFRVEILSAGKFGKNDKIGINCRPESLRDVEEAFDEALMHQFPAVYLYLADLSMIKGIRDMYDSIEFE